MEQTGRRPVVICQSDALTSVLGSVLVVPLTTNLDRAHLAGTALLHATEGGLPDDSVALAFQMRAETLRVIPADQAGYALDQLAVAWERVRGRLCWGG